MVIHGIIFLYSYAICMSFLLEHSNAFLKGLLNPSSLKLMNSYTEFPFQGLGDGCVPGPIYLHSDSNARDHFVLRCTLY